jgi:hypothetical protein
MIYDDDNPDPHAEHLRRERRRWEAIGGGAWFVVWLVIGYSRVIDMSTVIGNVLMIGLLLATYPVSLAAGRWAERQ